MNARLAKNLLSAMGYAFIFSSAHGQGTFQNLNFEQANVPDVPFGQFGANVSSLDGVPFWTTYIGTNQVGTIFHNNESLGAAAISILGPQWFPQRILEGNYTVQLQPSSAGPPTTA